MGQVTHSQLHNKKCSLNGILMFGRKLTKNSPTSTAALGQRPGVFPLVQFFLQNWGNVVSKLRYILIHVVRKTTQLTHAREHMHTPTHMQHNVKNNSLVKHLETSLFLLDQRKWLNLVNLESTPYKTCMNIQIVR